MDAKNKFMPSLFRGLYKTESVPVSWDEVYRIITEDDLVRQQTEMYRRVRNDEVKRSLPCITPAVQMNGTGKTAKDIVGLTGYTMCDLDHVPQERVEEVRRMICSDPHTSMCNVTVSGRGFHIISPYDDGMDYETAFLLCNAHYADLVGHDYDEQCMNRNRTFLLSHDSGAYYNPKAETFKAVKPKQGRWVKVEKDRLQAAVEYVEKSGVRYVEHSRHTFLVNCVFNMNKLGVPRQDVERWIAQYDRPERERRSIVRSIYENHTDEFGSYDAPYEWTLSSSVQSRASHAHTREEEHDDGELQEEEERLRRCPRLKYNAFPDYQWPRFLQQMVDCGETKAQRDVILLSAVTVLGAMLGRLLRFKYSKRYWHPALQTFIVAPPASGKSVVSLVRRVAEPLHDEQIGNYERQKKEYDKQKAAYDMAGKERANMEIPVPPVMRMFLIAGNNSSTGILENLADAQGHALICESEADTLSAAINADYGNWDDTLRRAFDHDRLSYNRRTNKEYRQIPYPCMGVLVCGTPAQVKPLITSAENGLFSRQLFATLPPIGEFIDQFGDDGIDLNSQFLRWGKECHEMLKQMKGEVSCIELRLSDEQKEVFNRKFRAVFRHAGATRFDHHMMSSVAREAINILRIMSVVALFRAIETEQGMAAASDIPDENVKDGTCTRYDLTVTEDDFLAVLSLVEPLYRTACEILTLLPWTEAERQPPTAIEQLLGSLPLTFTRKEAVELARQMGISEDTLDTRLRRMRKNDQLRAVGVGVYEFSGK